MKYFLPPSCLVPLPARELFWYFFRSYLLRKTMILLVGSGIGMSLPASAQIEIVTDNKNRFVTGELSIHATWIRFVPLNKEKALELSKRDLKHIVFNKRDTILYSHYQIGDENQHYSITLNLKSGTFLTGSVVKITHDSTYFIPYGETLTQAYSNRSVHFINYGQGYIENFRFREEGQASEGELPPEKLQDMEQMILSSSAWGNGTNQHYLGPVGGYVLSKIAINKDDFYPEDKSRYHAFHGFTLGIDWTCLLDANSRFKAEARYSQRGLKATSVKTLAGQTSYYFDDYSVTLHSFEIPFLYQHSINKGRTAFTLDIGGALGLRLFETIRDDPSLNLYTEGNGDFMFLLGTGMYVPQGDNMLSFSLRFSQGIIKSMDDIRTTNYSTGPGSCQQFTFMIAYLFNLKPSTPRS
ncbi:MAG: outer membrane beta-barrel protein [Bacteroidia bacterium]|nr:outer membrane beta-barrel protein [Bacteroidia bacterium]